MMESVDLDSILQSHGEIDSDEENSAAHNRTVDEILLLNYSSSSPSPPSSPTSTSYSAHNDVVFASSSSSNSKNPRFPHFSRNNYSSGANDDFTGGDTDTFTNKTKHAERQFLGGRIIRSNAKPGAAVAAASLSLPTPRATAIKLRIAAAAAAKDRLFTSSAVGSRDSENGSNDLESPQLQLEEEEVKLEQFQPAQLDSIADRPDYAEDSDKGGTDYVDQECTRRISETDNTSRVENERDSFLDNININEQVASPSLDEKSDETPLVFPASVPGENEEAVTSPICDEDATEGDKTSDFGKAITEPSDADDALSQSDVADAVENMDSPDENKSDNTKTQNISHSSIKPLDLAEEIEKKQAFTALHYEEGAAAQPMRLEGVRKGSAVLGYFDIDSRNGITRTISSQAFRRDHGSPQVVAVHLNYIATGMSRGSIFVVPSKYTAHHVDNMDAKMTLLGLQGDRSLIPVTSMCFNQQGDLLFAGYGDGHYTVWDVQKASALKIITEHRAPVVHMMYLGQDTQVTRQFNVVSGDSNGVVKLICFSIVPWFNRISYTKSMKLLDETTSRVVCASPLLYGEGHGGAVMSSQASSAVSASSIGSMTGGMVDEGVVIFITHQSALVAKVSPTVEVYAQIPKPDGVREGAMPYAAWKCMSVSLGSSSENAPIETSDKVSMLAIAWDKKVQVARLVKSELKVIDKWTLESPAIGLAWLDDQMLVILTLTAQLYLFAKDGNLIHQTNFSVDGIRGDDLISYHMYFTNAHGNPEKAYHNSIAVRGANIYILGLEHLVVSRLLSWKERIEVLRKAGDWIGALNMAMTLYDGKSHAVIDLPKNLDDIQWTVMPYLVELLQSYVTEVFSYISVACSNQNAKLDQFDEIKEQYTRVGGVAVEFCVHIRRTDILFDEVLARFDEAHHKETFLELLEPYILKDMLGSLPPAVMQALVEHYSKRGWLQRIEQCVLHMDILSLDFNQVVRLCREHRLHGALIYVFNKGLDDFKTPLEELLVVLRNSRRENAAPLRYRILVYLKYCFQGLAFPPGRGNLPLTRLPSLRKELLHFLLEASTAPDASVVTRLTLDGTYANLLHLLELDTEATLDVLRCAFTEDEISTSTHSQESDNFIMESTESEKLIQKIVDVLAGILDASYFQTDSLFCSNGSIEIWPSKKDVGHIYDFIAYYVAYGRANVSREILSQILEYLSSDVYNSYNTPCDTIEIIKRREKQLLSLLEVVPDTHWDAPYLLHMCEKSHFHKVCGYIHAIRYQYLAAMESYMKATNEPIYVFSFIHHTLKQLHSEEADAFELAVISCIPDLVKLSREGTYFMIIDHFRGRIQYIMSELQTHPESLFLYLKTAIEVHKTGVLNLSCLEEVDVLDFPSTTRSQKHPTGVHAYLEAISNFPKLVRDYPVHVTDEMMELYFELLCRYDRDSVLKFLETSESYRVEHCLRLCQEYGIVDAASFLLERVGEVGSALLLILSNLGEKFVMLDAEIRKGSSDTSPDNLNAFMKKKNVTEIIDTARACIGLCQRNSPRLEPDESENLWFQLLDSFCEPLTDSGNARIDSESEALKETLDGSSGELEDEEEHTVQRKFSKPRKVSHMMRKLISVFIKEIVEGMIGYVRLPRIMWKLLTDNGDQEFGDFKFTIMGMLGTYDFERRILDTAKNLIEDDTYYTMSLLTKGATHGYAPRSLVCCICNSLTRSSSDFSIQLFSCGHAMHPGCEVQENGASSMGTSTGCPICTPRKKVQKSSGKSVFGDHGSERQSSSKTQQARGTPAFNPHDHDISDNSYCLRPASRFEVLNNLQRDQKLIQIENMPQLRLAPPAVYHEKVKKRTGGSTSRVSETEKPIRSRQLKDVKVKVKGSSIRFPLKSNIFGKEKISRR
ncbi:hypothetical protein ACJIZ3_019347 [Penstemon smallii]|uniref:RING-type domain-containing protein n=1 Tax=Penstemon smallii TaxID=265156 RepID=A0ABD3T1V8_9LAMI